MQKNVPIRKHGLAVFLAFFIALLAVGGEAFAAGGLSEYIAKVQPTELFADADRFGDPVGEPAIAPVYKGADIAGYAYLNSDFTNSTGYSGKPIHIVVGIDKTGVVRGLKLVDHKEPIVLIGTFVAPCVGLMNSTAGANAMSFSITNELANVENPLPNRSLAVESTAMPISAPCGNGVEGVK